MDITDWEVSSNVSEVPPSVPVPQTPATPEVPAAPVPEEAVAEKPAEKDESEADPFERDPKGRIKRHKARSQVATPEDVPRIHELTRRLRETERKLADLTTKPADIPQVSLPKVVESHASGGFSEKEPVQEDFLTQPDPYAALQRALAAYDRRKDEFEAKQQATKERTEAQQKAQADQWGQITAAHQARAEAFLTHTKDAAERLSKAPARDVPFPPLLHIALLLDTKGPERMLYLAEHPDVLDELVLLTDGKPITDQTVAIVQRSVASRVKDAPTGSSTPAPVALAPRPLNPVRTAPTTPPDELPGDDSSLAEHEQVWGRSRRRRRA